MNSNVIVVGDWTSFHKDNEQSHLQVHLKVSATITGTDPDP